LHLLADTHVGDAGFGLTETLVSLALLAVLSLLILQGAGAGRNIWRGVATRAETAETIQGAQAVLRDRFERAFPATRYDAQQPYPDFSGTRSAMGFLAPPALVNGPAGLQRYLLHVDSLGNLVLSSTSDVMGLYPENYGVRLHDEVLLHGVQTLAVSYFDGTAGGGSWRTVWDRRPSLPALVRIQVAFAAGDTRWWPPLIVRAATTIDSECLNFNRTGHCGGRL
jgi:prepilin-type N-terminal cleavage/methylation domain-containing protein